MTAFAKPLNDRINLRTSTDEKSLFQRACELAGFRDLTTFIVTTMRRESVKLLRENTQLLSARDRDIVLGALESPPKANKHLQELMRR